MFLGRLFNFVIIIKNIGTSAVSLPACSVVPQPTTLPHVPRQLTV
jgi:hypothetical protein